MPDSPSWDPQQYSVFGDHRTRPFLDLIAQIRPASPPSRVVDLGCGTGNQTEILADRWPDAEVIGLDSSPEMLRAAEPRTRPGLRFELGDIVTADVSDADVVVSNAALQWVPEHRRLLGEWAESMRPGSWLAVQVPGNFDAPSHRIMRELAAEEPFAEHLRGVLRHDDAVDTPNAYLQNIAAHGFIVDAWETTYSHVLHGENPVVEWVRGTGLRPVLESLRPDMRTQFETEYASRVRDAYPATDVGTVFGFRRIFFVGRKRPSNA